MCVCVWGGDAHQETLQAPHLSSSSQDQFRCMGDWDGGRLHTRGRGPTALLGLLLSLVWQLGPKVGAPTT